MLVSNRNDGNDRPSMTIKHFRKHIHASLRLDWVSAQERMKTIICYLG